MSDVTRWYPSKIDGWLAAVLAIAPIAALAPVLAGIGGAAWISPIVMLAIYAGLVFPMRYGMTEDTLVIRFGLARHTISLADITHVTPTRDPLSAPALSLDRLEIRTGSGVFGRTRISPADRREFLRELASKARLLPDGDRLVRSIS